MAILKNKYSNFKNALLSPRGKNVAVFLIFVVISAILWVTMTLNEEVHKDIRCRIEITNCPDSVTMISYLPEMINVNVKARGSQLVKYSWGDIPTINIDYAYYKKGNVISLGDAELRGIFRNIFGSGAQILAIKPDSLSLLFTSRRPTRLPVIVDSRVTASPTAVLLDKPQANLDSVSVYSVEPIDPSIKHISTTPIQISGISTNKSMKVRLITPPGTRVEPDSVTVNISVEKLIVTNAKVLIETEGVPTGEKLLLFPNYINISYMLPMADYEKNHRGFKVVADYQSILDNPSSKRVKLQVVTDANSHAQNFTLEIDSVSYMIER